MPKPRHRPKTLTPCSAPLLPSLRQRQASFPSVALVSSRRTQRRSQRRAVDGSFRRHDAPQQAPKLVPGEATVGVDVQLGLGHGGPSERLSTLVDASTTRGSRAVHVAAARAEMCAHATIELRVEVGHRNPDLGVAMGARDDAVQLRGSTCRSRPVSLLDLRRRDARQVEMCKVGQHGTVPASRRQTPDSIA